ncbi:hypothetical protein [Agromyces aureus]|uniref:Lactococcin 972 family bacteriocin n=1 Tax=Agromyces aureus TaxID=453304 RepID=A0A191WB62_9MICO|nr:hypothetical protein [Agromyces aureus]ANJ25419.1 hypothetical protein ATC03_00165 [Agromyces aureus]
MTLAAAITVGLTLAASPAMAASNSGTYTCNSGWWSSSQAGAPASVAHRHEQDGMWRERTYPAGFNQYKGWWQPGPVYETITTSATSFSGGYLLGCST